MHPTTQKIKATPVPRLKLQAPPKTGTGTAPLQVLTLTMQDDLLDMDVEAWDSTCKSRSMESMTVRLDALPGSDARLKQTSLINQLKALMESGRLQPGTLVILSMHGGHGDQGFRFSGGDSNLAFDGASLMGELRKLLPTNLFLVTACHAAALKALPQPQGANTFLLASEESSSGSDARAVVNNLLQTYADQTHARSPQDHAQPLDDKTIATLWNRAKKSSGEQIRWLGQRRLKHTPAKARFDTASITQDRARLDKLVRTLRAQLIHGSLDSVKEVMGESPQAMLALMKSAGQTASRLLIHTASNCEKETREKIHFLLSLVCASERSAVLNQPDNHGCTALHWACEDGNLEAVQTLLGLGADASIRDDDGKTAFDLAKPKAKGALLRHLAADGNPSDLVGLELNAVLESADANGKTPLWHAVTQMNMAMANALLKLGANPDHRAADGKSLLELACSFGHPRWASLLLLYLKQPDLAGALCKTIENIARDQPGLAVLELLLQAGADPHTMHPGGHHSLLELACDLNQVEVLRRLLKYGARPDFRLSSGQTLREFARQRGRTEREWQEIHRAMKH